MLEVQHLKHRYDRNSQEIIFPDFNVEQGGELLILGASGSGKSTLLHILSGLLIPTSGSVTIDDIEINKLRTEDRNNFRKKNISVVFQRHYFIRALTALENLQYASYFRGEPYNLDKIKNLMDFMDLSSIKNKKIHHLSEGQKQRLSIARAIIHQPKLLLADEPTASLDDANCKRITKLLFDLRDQYQTTLLVVSHDNRLKMHFSKLLQLSTL